MARLYVFYLNHLDLIWRRPRYQNGSYGGCTVIPYSSIQEQQVEAGLDFARAGGCYDIEQAITLREYLERNPDTYEEIRQMIADGRLHILGGGESVVDYNLPTGEALIRNHTYALRWLKNEFGVRPRYAECPDTFGLSAGLPALFTQLGYQGMAQYSRVFPGYRPFWRGISGAVLPLATVNGGTDAHSIAPFLKSRTCGICQGEGCAACNGIGYVPVRIWEDPEELKELAHEIHRRRDLHPGEDVYLAIGGEEALLPDDGYARLQEIAAGAGLQLQAIGLEGLIDKNCSDLLERYRSGEYTEEEIDPRPEGNPVAAGCYTSRIRIKQAMRRCEAALMACERLAASANRECGAPYPAKAIERLWRQLQVINFHDGVPASHSDDAYDELMEMANQLCVKANRITNRAIAALVKVKGTDGAEGIPFVVFNPLEFPVENVRLQGAVKVSEFVTGGYVQAPDGSRIRVRSLQRTAIPEHSDALIEFVGSLPAFGYTVFRFIPEEFGKEAVGISCKEAILENEHLRVVIANGGIRSAVDKHTGRLIADKDTFIPYLTDDTGHAWGRTAHKDCCFYGEAANFPDYGENMVQPREFSRSLEMFTEEGGQRAVVHIRYSRPDQNLRHLDWVAEYELTAGAQELQVKITTAFDALNLRLSTQVVLPEIPADGKLEYEIPLGKIARGEAFFSDALGEADDWPALHYVCAQLEGVNVLLCNNGTPAHKLNDRVITTALLRNPTQTCCGFGFEKIADPSPNTFRFTLSASPDRDLTPYRRGMALNASYPVLQGALAVDSGRYLQAVLPDNVPLLALKGAEDGNGLILRYLGVEQKEELRFAHQVYPTDLLEETQGESVTTAAIAPYDIATFRWR